jgi:hypothetical protein
MELPGACSFSGRSGNGKIATDIAQYTGQCSGLTATERTRSEIILFSFELDLTVLVRLLIEQR